MQADDCNLEGALGVEGLAYMNRYPDAILKAKFAGYAGSGAVLTGDGAAALKDWVDGTSMCGLRLKGPLLLSRVSAWLEAWLDVNSTALERMETATRHRLQRKFRRADPAGLEIRNSPEYRKIFESPFRAWFLRFAEVHISRPTIHRAANPTFVFGLADGRSRAPGSCVPLPAEGAPDPCWHEPRHNDGAGSVMHMSLTLYGARDVHLEQGTGAKTDAPRMWKAGEPPDMVIPCAPGTVYVGQLTGCTHQVHHRRPRAADLWRGEFAVTVQFRTNLFASRQSRLRDGKPHPEPLFLELAECWRRLWSEVELFNLPLEVVQWHRSQMRDAPAPPAGSGPGGPPGGAPGARRKRAWTP